MTTVSVGVIGAGHIGGNIARRLVLAGYPVTLSFARDQARLAALAADIGARIGQPADAAKADIVVLSMPWPAIGEALTVAGSLAGRVVVDTTNQFGANVIAELDGRTAARHNSDRIPGAKYVKCFNTLTSAFQARAAERQGEERVVQWMASDDEETARLTGRLVSDAGYIPVHLSSVDNCHLMEAPRRPGAVYGEEYREREAGAVVEAIRAGRPIPPTPSYS